MARINDKDYNDHFTLANIPYGVISTPDNSQARIATRLHGSFFVISELIQCGLLGNLDSTIQKALSADRLNEFASLPREAHRQVRQGLQKVLDTAEAQKHAKPVASVKYHMPISIGDFTDFSCSRNHVLNASRAMTGKESIPPGFLHFPIGYSGRCSSIVAGETVVKRPTGQFLENGSVVLKPSEKVDFELELGVIVGKDSTHGSPVPIDRAEEYMFGVVLVNDWSSRDIQGLEMIPLGPLSGKSFCTTISPWIITMDALRPFAVALNQPRNPPEASYLQNHDEKPHLAIDLEVNLVANGSTTNLCTSKSESLYWTLRDLLVQQTLNGCPLRSGDMLATGTISGSSPGSFGCLLETTENGKNPAKLSDGSHRSYLLGGDKIVITASCGTLGTPEYIGFGPCTGTIQN